MSIHIQCTFLIYLLVVQIIIGSDLELVDKTVETEMFRGELAKVRAELEPWEKQLIEHKGKLDVASTESKLLNEKVRMEIQLSCFFVYVL